MSDERVSDERLEAVCNADVISSISESIQIARECQRHRARLAQAGAVVDLEGLNALSLLVRRELGAAAGRSLDALLAALVAGAVECPVCEGMTVLDCNRGYHTDHSRQTCEECPVPLNARECAPCDKCHGSGQVILLAVNGE